MLKPSIIFDWDCTLAEPVKRAFYALHKEKTKEALAIQYGLSPGQVDRIDDVQKARNARLEEAFFSTKLTDEFNLSSDKAGSFGLLHQSLESISPEGWFLPDPELVELVARASEKYQLVVLSNSPVGLIGKIGKTIGFDMGQHFLAVHGMTPQDGPPKYVDADAAFARLITAHDIEPATSWSIGDSVYTDLIPARKQGLNIALIDNLGTFKGEKPSCPIGNVKNILCMLLK